MTDWMVVEMSRDLRASNARAMGNYGLWEALDRAPDVGSDDVDIEHGAPTQTSRWLQWRGRAIRWSLAGGMFLAYVNHWPGGH